MYVFMYILPVSPSVLDRLNPLLEPGGALSIDERGIVNDDVVTVTPHPDFRYALNHFHCLCELTGIRTCTLMLKMSYMLYTFIRRIFLLMDPAHGEISRAMRNRGIEICILSEVSCGIR